MNLLPNLTYLGILSIIEVYEAYDEPCLFACQNASGQIYIAVLIDENEDHKKWLYTALSKVRFEYIRSGGIDLHDGFRLAEDGIAHIVEIPFSEEKSTIEVISCVRLSENMLPFPGEFVRLETQTLPILPTEELDQKSLALWREILRFKVKFPEYSRNEAPIKLWGKMLSSLQEVIESIGHYIGLETMNNATRKIIAQQTELLATVTSGGSYCVDLVAATNANVLRDSLIGSSLDMFLNLIHAGNRCSSSKGNDFDSSNEDFTKIVAILGKQFASKYRIFLKCVADAESDINLNWSSPHPERGGSAILTYMDVISALYIMNKMEIMDPEILEITGILVGGNVKSKRFEISDIDQESTYKGEISDSLLSSNPLILDNTYKVTMEESIEVNKATGELKPKYKLTNLELLELVTHGND